MDLHELKALEIAARHKIVWKGDHWSVPSQSGNGKYKVTLKPESCACDDYQLRGQLRPCKHVLAARFVQERDNGGKPPRIETDTVPKRPTYSQNWPAYNLAQRIEKHRFLELLHDLCRNIEEPPQPKVGRRRHLHKDAVFAMTYKVYSGFPGRRFSCDLADAHAKGYLTRPVCGIKVNTFIEEGCFTPILKNLIVLSSLPLKAVETAFAPDSTGFSTGRLVRWYDEKYGVHKSGFDWVKCHLTTGVKTNIVTAVEIDHRDAGDSPQLKPMVETTAQNFTIKELPADKAYLSHDNLELIEGLGGTPYVPYKSNSLPGEPDTVWQRLYFYYHYRREEFLKHYHQRSNVESTISSVKRKFGDGVRSKTDTAMRNEVLCKFLCNNICVVIMSQCELGIEPAFWPENPKPESADILPMKQPS